MAQSGFTPIKLYSSSTAAAVPLAANLAAGELAINTADGKLFYEDSSGVVQVIGWKTTPATAGGTGQTSYAVGDLLYASTTTALSKLADIATGNALISGGVGAAPSYGKIGLTTHVSGTLPIANGGTNATTASITSFNNITGYSASGATGTTSTNLVFSTSPTLITPALGTPSALVGTNITGTASGLTAGNVTTNANLTGAVTSVGNATSLGSFSSANLRTALTDETGTGVAVFGTSPAITTSLTTGSTTFALLNTTATTLNIGGAATAISIGAATGTLTVANTTLAANAITASTTLGVTGVSTLTGGAVVEGLTVGLGAGAVTSNTVVGRLALFLNSTGFNNVAVGDSALNISNGSYNTAVGFAALVNATGSNNTGFGYAALQSATGSNNTGIGNEAGYAITTGSYNVVLGSYDGSAAPISATGSNWIVLSDGAGSVRQAIDSAGNSQFLTGAVVVYAPDPAPFSGATTLTNANLQTQILVTSGLGYTLTMPTGTTLDTLVAWAAVDIGFDFSLINTGSGTITMAVNTGVTIVGATTVLISTSGRFRIRRTAASTYVVYRIG
jgi:hypothetical protein